MTVTDKTRKALWGRSGNRCALCRRELIIDGTPKDDESIVGDECHIVSAKGQGPRCDPGFPLDGIDDPQNLILLCRVHHKMVDDQSETYTVEMLTKLKQNHEKWVSSSLAEEKTVPPVRIKRIRENIPAHLIRISAGQDLFNILDGAMGFSFENDEPKSEEEVGVLSSFFQEAQDWGDLSSDMEAGERVSAKYRLTNLLKELEDSGFWVFGATEVRRMEGGIAAPSSFPIAILKAVRANSPEVIPLGDKKDGA